MTAGHDQADTPAAEPRRHTLTRGQYWIAYVMGAYGLAMNTLSNFLVPLRARELGASFEVIGIIVASAAVAGALLSVSFGGLTDRLGPRRAFMLATGVNVAVCLGFVTVTNYWLLVPLQVLLGSFRSFGWIASQGYITAIGTPKDRASLAGRFSFFSNVGQMIMPLPVGALAQIVGYRYAFFALAAYSAVFAVLGWSAFETGAAAGVSERKRGASLRTAWQLMRVRGMQVVLLFTSARLWIAWVWAAFFPVYLSDQGVAPAALGSVVFAKALTSTLTAPTTGWITRFVSKQVAIALALGIGAVGLAVSSAFSSLPGGYVPAMCVGIAIGISLPLLLGIIGDVIPDDQRGVALGLRVTANQTAAAAAPLVAGPLLAIGAALGFGLTGGVAAAILTLGYVRSRGIRENT